jgi:hydrogenase/urease accessory protein HupE
MGVARKACLLLAVLSVSATPAHAHLMNSGFGPFYDGLAHPLMSPEDLLPVIALTLLAGLSGARCGRWLLATLPPAWMMGMTAGWALPLAVIAPWMSAIATVLAGVAVAADLKPPLAMVMGLAATIGVLHGLANGAELAAGSGRLVATTGTVCCIAVIVSLAAGQVTSLRAQCGRLAFRIAGSWIAAVGLLMLGWSARA